MLHACLPFIKSETIIIHEFSKLKMHEIFNKTLKTQKVYSNCIDQLFIQNDFNFM